MNILLASYFPLPSLGGIWTFVEQLNNELKSTGHRVDIFSLNSESGNYRMIGKEEIDRKQFQLGQKTRVIPFRYLKNPWISHVELSSNSMKMSALHYGLGQFDIIHAQDVFSASVLKKIKPR